MSLTTLENAHRAQECAAPAAAVARAEHSGARAQRDGDFLAARAAAHMTIAILEQLLDDPTNPDALAAARQHLNDNPWWVLHARLFIAAQPD